MSNQDKLCAAVAISAGVYGFFFCRSNEKGVNADDLVKAPLSASVNRGVAAGLYSFGGSLATFFIPQALLPSIPPLLAISGGYYVVKSIINSPATI